MRIVQLVTQQAGGPVDHALDVAGELARRGHDSHVVGPGGGLASRPAVTGLTLHPVAMDSKHDLRGAGALARAVRTLRPDVLHCQDRRAGLAGRAVGRALRTPALVYTLHGVADGLSDLVAGNLRAAPRRRRDALYYLAGERWLSRAAGGRVVVPSQAVARFALESARLRPARVDVVPNGVDVERFRPRRHAVGPLTTAVWIGLMAPVKRLDILLDACAELPELRLRLIGAGPEQAALARAIRERGLSTRVDMPGPVADPATDLAAADLFVLTSAAENCPLALLQAMACGLPVVASRVGGIPEVVRDGVDGVLVPPGDAPALAAAIGRLLADPDGARAMGARARARVCDRYTVQACVDGLLESYAKAMS
jgi:glycosyltransferase involved in cell wall biosynthesis